MSTVNAPLLSPDDKLQFFEDHRPGLKAGDYHLTLTQRVTSIDAPAEAPFEAKAESQFSVAGERFSLAKQEVHSLYPPVSTPGHYENCLPHVALRRSTLPWERSPRSDKETLESPSWLALLVFTEGQSNSSVVPVAKLPDASVHFPANYPKELLDDPTQNVTVLDVKWGELKHQIPSYEDLRHVAHVRQVMPESGAAHTELAFVMGSAFPRDGVRSEVHLVSLEGRYRAGAAAFADGATEFAIGPGPGGEDFHTLASTAMSAGARVEVEISAGQSPRGWSLKPLAETFPWSDWQSDARGYGTLDVAGVGSIRFERTQALAEDKDTGKRRVCRKWVFTLPQMKFFDGNASDAPWPAALAHTAWKDKKKTVAISPKQPEDLGTSATGNSFGLKGTDSVVVSLGLEKDGSPFLNLTSLVDTAPMPVARWFRDLPAGISRVELTEPVNAGLAPDVNAFRTLELPAMSTPWEEARLDAMCRSLLDADWAERLRVAGRVELSRWFSLDGGVPRAHRLTLRYHKTEDQATLVFEPAERIFFDANGSGDSLPADDERVRLVSLFHWAIDCQKNDHPAFLDAAKSLNDQAGELRLPAKQAQEPAVKARLLDGYVPLPHHLRNGDRSVSWYRGPLCHWIPSGAEAADKPLPARCSDELLEFDPSTGLLDATYAAAWELGRQMALSDRHFSLKLYQWKRDHRHELARDRQWLDNSYFPTVLHPPHAPELSDELAKWLDSLSLLEGVPASYLIPDEAMLPLDSLRRFTVDPAWISCLRDGAFSIGRVVAADLDSDSLHGEMWPPPDRVSGFLLRSALVRDYPALVVEAYVAGEGSEWKADPHLDAKTYRKLNPVRIARLSPDILIALFSGVGGEELNLVELHLPPEVLHFGFDEEGGNRVRQLRNPATGKPLVISNHDVAAALDLVLDTPELLTIQQEKHVPAEELLKIVTYYGSKNPGVLASLPEPQVLSLENARLRSPLVIQGKTIEKVTTSPREELKRFLEAAGVAKEHWDAVADGATAHHLEKLVLDSQLLRQSDPAVIRMDALFGLIADRLRPLFGIRPVSSADFALQMLEGAPLSRIRFEAKTTS